MPTPRRSLRPRAVIATLVLAGIFLVGGVLGFRLLSSLKETPGRMERVPPRTAVRVARVSRGTYRQVLQGYGQARALRVAEVAAEVPGVVRRVGEALEAGSPVEADQVLVVLDDRDLRSRLAAAEAGVERLQASLERVEAELGNLEARKQEAEEDLESARRELRRLEALAKRSSSSKSELDVQRRAVSQAKGGVLQLRQQMDAARLEAKGIKAQLRRAGEEREQVRNDLERTKVEAPFAGVVERRHVDTGERVAPGEPLFRLVDTGVVEVPVVLGASHYAAVEVGAPVSLRLTVKGPVIWRGSVARKSPTVEPADRTFQVYVEVPAGKTQEPLPPGAFVVADVVGRTFEDVMAVPRTAFLEATLFVARPTGEDQEAVVEARQPRVRRWEPETALVAGGLEPGELVVLTNLEQLVPGQRVLIMPAGRAEPGGRGNGR